RGRVPPPPARGAAPPPRPVAPLRTRSRARLLVRCVPVSRIPEKVVAEVVTEVSERMRDPGYAQLAIGSFAEAHPDAGRFIAAHLDELGGGEAVMQVVFHAEVIHECFRRHLDRSLPRVGFRDLDAVANGELVDALQKRQPAL